MAACGSGTNDGDHSFLQNPGNAQVIGNIWVALIQREREMIRYPKYTTFFSVGKHSVGKCLPLLRLQSVTVVEISLKMFVN